MNLPTDDELLAIASKTAGAHWFDHAHVLRFASAVLAAVPAHPIAPEGFKLVAVKGLDDLTYWLDRCDSKGHLDNCSDLIEPWANFDWREFAAAPQAVPANTVTPLNVGRWCMSEDECRALGIDFAAYERGVSDAAEAFGRNKP